MITMLVPYLVMNGNAAEAIAFYQEALHAEVVVMQTFGEMPQNPEMPLPEEAKSLIGHATIKVGQTDLMFSDAFPGTPHQLGNQVTICLCTDDVDTSKQAFAALEQGGQVSVPLIETHFSPGYAVITDKFGVTWQLYTNMHQ
ncbi:VOC family protein [Paenibacillus lignilyticus]|uniref:VOC family protein n=1 Tax=Paenibacillus lignilyticus TaxID=1172615 RepID=A0ABS5CFM1_9BACL|nr:VOC family protein [Paenibacillus lignilyticus]MBP3964640.1 VOC family protein [Paenibacillus lignilyticus]